MAQWLLLRVTRSKVQEYKVWIPKTVNVFFIPDLNIPAWSEIKSWSDVKFIRIWDDVCEFLAHYSAYLKSPKSTFYSHSTYLFVFRYKSLLTLHCQYKNTFTTLIFIAPRSILSLLLLAHLYSIFFIGSTFGFTCWILSPFCNSFSRRVSKEFSVRT